MFRKEVTYIFEIEGYAPIKSDVYVDIYSCRRFPDPNLYTCGIGYKGTGDEYKVIKAELLHTGEPRDVNLTPKFTETEYMFRLPDVNEYVMIAISEGGYSNIGIVYMSPINH